MSRGRGTLSAARRGRSEPRATRASLPRRRIPRFLLASFILSAMAACQGRPLPRVPSPSPETPVAPVGAATAPATIAVSPGRPIDPARVRLLEFEDRRIFDGEAIAPFLASGDPSIRGRSARALGRVRDAAAFPLLDRLAADSEPSVRREAAFALGLIRGSDARRRLEELLGDADPEVAATAAWALGLVGDAAALPALEGALAKGVPRPVTREILLSLHRYVDPRVVALAASRATDVDRELREAAVYALARRPVAEAAPILARALGDSSPRARGWALRGLGLLGRPADLPAVVASFSDPDRSVRVQALRGAGALLAKAPAGAAGRDAAVAGLVAAAADRDVSLARTAVEALGLVPADGASPAVVAALERNLDASTHPDLREEAVVSLARVAPDRFLARLPQLLGDPSPLLRGRVAEGLGRVPPDAASLAAFEPLLDDPQPPVRAAAVSSLRDGDLPRLSARLSRLLDDGDVVVRAEAIARLAKGKDPQLPARLPALLEKAGWDESNDAALAVVEAAAGLAPAPEAKGLLEQALKLDDPLVRRAARAALVDRWAVPPAALPSIPFDREEGAPLFEALARREATPVLAAVETTAGNFVLRLRPDEAPRTVESFVGNAALLAGPAARFHRVVPDFVVQGGDPRGDGSGGPGYQIRDELNRLRYGRGAVGMALSGPDTGGSQYFVTHSPQPHLDGTYTIFGQVIAGLDIVDRLTRRDRVLGIRLFEGATAAGEGTEGLPPLIGELDAASLPREVPSWGEAMRAANPSAADLAELESLAAGSPFEMEVRLSASASSGREVAGRLLAVLSRLPGLDATVRFVGIPSDDAAVPSIRVRRAGREIGRIDGGGTIPVEQRLLSILRPRTTP